MNIISDSPLVFTLDGLFTDEECNDILSLVSPDDFKVATITMGNNEFLLDMDYRSNTRVIRDDTKLANDLYLKLVDHLPPQFKGWYLDGLNTRFRFYRYTVDQKFEKHFDGRYRESIDRESRLTFLLYLTDSCIGGSTSFFDTDTSNLRFEVKPKKGQVLVFDHHQLHSGEPVISGTKDVIRTDVMYRRFV